MKDESNREREQRIKGLWKDLDTKQEGQLDLKGFKRGLKKIDHPLKNADGLLREVLKAVDTSGDGQIQYNEFQVFLEQTEKELWQLFETIDHDQNGHVDKQEMKDAFARAGLTVSKSKLDRFFNDMDTNKDGLITFDEWRDFLLFIPENDPNLREVLSYYSETGNLNPEGDVHINEPFQGSGIAQFPSLCISRSISTLQPHLSLPSTPEDSTTPLLMSNNEVTQLDQKASSSKILRSLPNDISHIYYDNLHPKMKLELEWLSIPIFVRLWLYYRWFEEILTESTPHIGYFLAGGMAGAVSRTATAPFDRLKVYLIAQTSTKTTAMNVAKSGSAVKAAEWMAWPIVEAVKDLWRAGGIRSLFAGNGLNVVKVMPESALKFGAYEASKRMFASIEGHHDPKHLLPVSQFLAGGIGGMVSQCCVYPLDTLKFRMQCETVEGGLHGNRLIAATAAKMWQSNGVSSFFRGLPLGLVGMFPFAAIDLMIFEYLKSTLIARKARLNHCHEDDAPLNSFTTGAIGAFSGAFSASIVYPLNVLRTRLQAQGTVLHRPTYTGIADVTLKTIQSEGTRGLYRGLTPNLLKVVPSVSISYIVYENSKRLFGLY
ncbi:hypothetical protein FQN57_005034 [Myotisia sp. PD_48]|nr:hypothetical protein FQN57_005034 [Myotisia sp. PD_48]